MIRMQILFIAIICTALLIGVSADAVDLTISTPDIGTSYIQWSWNTGYNITTIMIDGKETCGYETLSNIYLQSNLDPDSLHSIEIVSDAGDYGNATATTLPDTPVTSFDSDSTAAAFGLVGGLITSVLVVRQYVKKGKTYELPTEK